MALYKSVGRRVNKRYLKTLIEKKKKQYKVSSEISPRTVRTWARRGLAKSSVRGAKSPLADVEKALVEICVLMGKIRQPLHCTEAIELMNNLIKLTERSGQISNATEAWF